MTKMGAPSLLTEEVKEKIFDCLVVKGLSVVDTCKECGIGERTFYSWYKDEDSDFLQFSARLRETKAHKHMVEADRIVAELYSLDPLKEDKEALKFELNKLRSAFDMKLRIAGKYNKRVYGDNIDVTSGGKEIRGVGIVPSEKDAEEWGKQ